MAPAKDLQFHRIHEESNISEFDVFIAGSGPIGATFARCLVDAGYNVLMVELGDQDTRIPGEHKKNEIEYQKDIDRFVKVIQATLSVVSIPRSQTIVPTLGPAAWTAKDPDQMWITNGRNHFQGEHNNLGAEAVTRGVGGMSTHWTCATPEFLKGLERPVIFTDTAKDDAEWKILYESARSLIGTSETEFKHSIRHNVVLEALQQAYPNRGVKALPLACHRLPGNSPYVQWHAANDIYGDMFDESAKHKLNKDKVKRGYFKLLTNTRCTRFELDTGATAGHRVGLVEVQDLLAARLVSESSSPEIDFYIKAKAYVVAAGELANPQILANSGFGATTDRKVHIIPNLVSSLVMAFCQIALLQVRITYHNTIQHENPWWKAAVADHKKRFGGVDPLPIPFQDPEPQVTIPASLERPWHTQIHRDAFSYGEVGPSLDSRIVVDLRFFGMQEGVPENKMIFQKGFKDAYGMPQPTFEYTPTAKHAEETQRMMNDMTDVANKLGAYLPKSEPQFMTPGLALHLGGTTRLGLGQHMGKTVANFNSQVWNFSNLFVGGNGTIPTPFGANPTLTSMCLALRAAYKIAQSLKDGFSPALDSEAMHPTPASWLSWTTDPNDPNFPIHAREVHREI
ncbi:putative pyranose oxidase [Mycena albidolilacea]|uniref:Pyranose 2-oxidase n=1 Tax=Mycena albidolilacea TaxID=1033008 RepID=A0AAD6Z2N3_9AGAR|nr:putative pyranose oxidase [Mycena albidolilacea]